MPQGQSVDYVWVTENLPEARDFYKLRPSTVVVDDSVESLQGFLEAVKRASRKRPARNLILVAHAHISGILKIKLFDDDEVAAVDAERLQEILQDGGKRSKLTIPKGLLQGSTPFLHIRGCRIGQAKRFLTLLRQVIGGQVHVSGLKHWGFWGPFVDGDTGEVAGFYEYQLYDFRLLRTKKLAGAAAAREELRKKRFTFYDRQTAVPDDYWKQISDDDFPHPLTGQKVFQVQVQLPFTTGRYNLESLWYFDTTYYPGLDQPKRAAFPLQGKPDPGKGKQEAEALQTRKELLAKYLQKQTSFPAEIERFGFSSGAEFFAGWNWTIDPLGGRPDELQYGGTRFEYAALFPVTDLRSGQENRLVATFYPRPEFLKKHPKLRKKYKTVVMLEPEQDKDRFFHEIL